MAEAIGIGYNVFGIAAISTLKSRIVQKLDHPGLRSKPRLREALILALLAVVALTVAWTLAASSAALAEPMLQDSPVASPEQLSPLSTTASSVEPTETAPIPALQPAAAIKAEPPIPMAALIGVMLVLGLIALVLGLRKRER